MVGRFLVRQITKPSNIIGPLVLGPVWNRRNRALNDSALKLLALKAGDDVLEVGFGGGYLFGQALARVTRGCVAGIDRIGSAAWATVIMGFLTVGRGAQTVGLHVPTTDCVRGLDGIRT